jgi:hypothetical protein
MPDSSVVGPICKLHLGHCDRVDPVCTASIGARDPLSEGRSRALVLPQSLNNLTPLLDAESGPNLAGVPQIAAVIAADQERAQFATRRRGGSPRSMTNSFRCVHLVLSQSLVRADRYDASPRFDTVPSRCNRQSADIQTGSLAIEAASRPESRPLHPSTSPSSVSLSKRWAAIAVLLLAAAPLPCCEVPLKGPFGGYWAAAIGGWFILQCFRRADASPSRTLKANDKMLRECRPWCF